MLLMVSVQDLQEAKHAIKGEADIVDVKNLQEALVGSAHPVLVKQVRDLVPLEQHASVTLGVVPKQVGTVAMAVYTAGILNATSVKVGFMNTEYSLAKEILLASKEALEGSETKLIGSLFADSEISDGIDPGLMQDLAVDGNCDGWLIDTITKDGRNLFDFMEESQLRDLVFSGKKMGISTALSGHLKLQNLDEISRINPDIVGVRGAVCAKQDRSKGVYWESVKEFKRQLNLRQTGEINVLENVQNKSIDNLNFENWIVVDGTGKNCASILSELDQRILENGVNLIEAIIPDILNTYDVVIWAEQNGHSIINQRKDNSTNSIRILIKP
ncbi:MAG: hypothetical protein FI718_04820 [SAR202 cluster bacterium]|nr:hypothetical protein [SAR202 cluster bacterium]MQG39291.1 hypothetical protein [SAR202 cluster bacterium]|tara:strand:- start:13338 stop:14324 length:987 start_codon:yes stop_codon:yes gene_type:complete